MNTNIIAGYQIIERVYESSRSLIYRGKKENEEKTVILKILNEEYPTPEAMTRFKLEYEIITQLNTEGVIKAYSLEKYHNTLVMILEDFDGESLKNLLIFNKLNVLRFLLLALQIVNSLGEIHQKNIIHKDINPYNILYDKNNKAIKIIDFGIATITNQEENIPLNNTNFIAGTLAYISPEQTGRMNRSIDYRTDFYSLGVTFYEMLTNKLPYDTTDPIELVHSHIAKKPISPAEIIPTIPLPVANIILKLLAKNPEERYQSIVGIKADLQSCLNQLKTTKKISNFLIGKYDISQKFQISQKLYGREQEIETLLATFARVNKQGKSEIILISGYAGIGKSSVVQEIYKPITEQRGYFITGDFEKLQQNIPYMGIINALQSLMKQILTENQNQIFNWREKILTSLDKQAKIIIDVIPELELIIGQQPNLPELPPIETQNRFNLVFENFISVFAKKEHPIVIFLDNLQWADLASFKLIQLLMKKIQNQYLLLICAYRENEVTPLHPLSLIIQEIEKTPAYVNYMSLAPLQPNHIFQLIADTLKCKVNTAKPLGELVYEKTNGNPFFVKEFLKSLYEHKLVTFNKNYGIWEWDLNQIQRTEITDNVVELMVSKIKKLPDETQEIIKIAAAIGNEFNLGLLGILVSKNLAEIINLLTAALEQSLIFSGENNPQLTQFYSQERDDIYYKFLHERVQQAAYSLISPHSRKEVHLQIGRIILENTSETQTLDRLFDIVNHLNIGADLITDNDEKFQLANLNFLAGTKAKESTAYNTALQHFNQAIKILSDQIWTTYYYLGLNLYKERSECEYLSGDFPHSEQTFDLILSRAKSNIDKADVYSIKTVQYANLSRVEEAIEVGLEGLKMLGFDLPKQPNKNHLQNALNEIKKILGNRSTESLLHLTTMTELEKKAAMKLLINLTIPAYYANINLHNLIILQMVIISLKYGNTSETAYSYIMYGAILQSYHQNYHTAYEFGELGLQLHEKYKNIHLSAKVINQFGVYIAPWKKHLKNVVNIFINAYETGLEVGDLIFTGYAAHNIIIYLFLQGEQLREFNIVTEKYVNFLQRINHEVITYSALLWQHLSLSLQGLTNTNNGLSSDKFDERLFLSKAEDNQFAYALNQYFIIKLQLKFFDEKYPEALEYSLKAEKTLNASHGAIYIVEYYFYSALVIAALYPAFHGENKKNYGKKLQNHQEKLKEWTLNCPENFQHKYFLVSAEIARISGQYKQAMDLYNQAIAVAKENEYIQIEALANELAAKFYLSNGYELIAKAYMTEARYAYIKWGATTKVKSLEEKYLQFLYKVNQGNILMSGGNTNFFTSIAGTGFTLLDLPTVMKASQAIAGEIKLDKLLEKLMNFIIQNAGAQKGFLLLENNGNLFIEAEGSAEEYQVTVLQSIEMDTARAAMLLPVGLINYVARTKQSVVLNNASVDGNFTNDLYINSYLPKSILCTALINQGKLIGVVYLENSLTTDAFTPDRLELINLLSAQIAISLENAKIYKDLAATNEAYSRFVPKEFLQFLNKQSIVDVKLGDQVQKEMSVLFADIRDFTTLSETMTPEDNFKFINSYLSRMEPLIVGNNGFIDKYIGDAIMALFPGSADDAVQAAIGMLQELKKYNDGRERAGYKGIEIGIGINTGSLMLGTVGGHNRMDSTAISDTVNLASRLEGLTKEYRVSLVISQNTFWQLEDASIYGIRLIDQVKVKGKMRSVAVFEIFEADDSEVRQGKLSTQTLFEEALLLCKSGKLEEAKKLFKQCLLHNPEDKVAQIYLQRCQGG